MSSSLARSRSLRKPTDLSSSSTAPQRNVSPSRLPAPPPTRPTTRNVSSGSLNDTAAAAAPKKKPSALSSLLSRGSSTRQTAARKDASSTSSTTAPSSRTANASTRTSSTREPTAGLNKLRNPAASSTSNLPGTSGSSSGSTRPTTSSGLAQKRTTPASSTGPGLGHTRARSVATLNGSTTLPPPNQSSTTSRSTAPKPRPTSLYGAPSTSTNSLTSSTAAARRPGSAAAQDPARPPRPGSGSSTSTTSTATTSTTNLTHKPSVASISTRTRAGSTASTKPPSKPQTRQQTTPTSPRHPKPPVRQQQQTSQPASPRSPRSPPRNKPLLKPAFTTLQQHYSPAKNLAPKPLTATYLAPPSPSKLPTNVALSAETSRLQTELLQLHLLHRDLPATTSQWHASARSHLASLHASLASSSKDLVSLEADVAERLNVAALHRWATPRKGLLEEKIQRLDALLTSLWSLDSPGGKHNRLVRAFERWASSLSDLEAARARADGPDSDPAALLDANLEVRFGGGLDARWKEECALLVRRLEGWDLQLKELAYDGEEEEADDVAQTSSLKRMLNGCESLIKDMLGELAVMEEIEAAAVQRETEWIKKMNRQGDDGGKRDTPRAGAVWRVI